MKPKRLSRTLISLVSLFLMVGVSSLAVDLPKTTSMKGKVFRSDTKEPIANARIVLKDEQSSDKQDNKVETKTDDQGNYTIPSIASGVYTVLITAWYKTREEAPCQLVVAKSPDKNSHVLVGRDKDKFAQQVIIQGYSVTTGKEIVKDFDFTCTRKFEQ